MKKELRWIVVGVFFVFIAGVFYQFEQKNHSDSVFTDEVKPAVSMENTDVFKEEYDKSGTLEQTEKPVKSENGFCYVCGQVKNPGVYEFEQGERLDVLINKAGGFTKKAWREGLNLARFAVDGEKVYVPSKDEAEKGTTIHELVNETEENDKSEEKVNLNTADAEKLTTLPGVGASKAASIIAYRQEHGSFRSIEELKNVEGIKDRVYEKIKDFVSV